MPPSNELHNEIVVEGMGLLTADEAVRRDGYYIETQSSDILRVVDAELLRNSRGICGAASILKEMSGASRFVAISPDANLHLRAVEGIVRGRFGREPSGRLINVQSAYQPDGSVITEEAVLEN
jgi:hypothetical protein